MPTITAEQIALARKLKHKERPPEPQAFTLGWELEATKAASAVFPESLDVCNDGSVHGDAIEYKIKRELVRDPKASLKALYRLCADKSLAVDMSCGFHVHIGLMQRTRRASAWAGWFANLARLTEDTAFKAVPDSRLNNAYCRRWKEGTYESLSHKDYSGNKYDNRDRYYWVNVVEMFRPGGIRTVEVRLMGHTKSYPYLLAWASACHLMGASAWRLVDDPSRLNHEMNFINEVFGTIESNWKQPSRYKLATARSLAERAGLWDSGNMIRFPQLTPPVYHPLIGDIVLCVREPRDGNMTVGTRYRVRDVGTHHGIYITGDSGEHRYVDSECYVFSHRPLRTEIRETENV